MQLAENEIVFELISKALKITIDCHRALKTFW